MATIVNARDVLLQAATPRVATVEMAPNLVVSQDQVDGLGIVIDGTKLVFLQATTQVFQIAKTGTVTPASTTLTAIVRNLAASPTLSVISGTITPAPTLSGGQVTIAHGNMTTDTATLRLTVVEDSVTYTDEITLVKVREGADGVVGYLTNENHTLPADNLGNVLSYSGCSGTFKMYQGTSDITTLCTYSIVSNPSTLTVSLNASTGAYVVSGGYPTGTDVTTLTMRATFGTATFDKVMTIAKSKNGTVGQRGSRTWYVALTGSTNTYSDTLATTTASADGGPILNDTVTQYNNSQNFSQTKFWNGTSWVVVNAVVDGNLLVSGTVGAQKIAANAIESYHILADAITADKINVTDLSAVAASLGTVQIDASGYLRTNGATAFGTGTGVWMGQDGGVYKLRVGNPSGNKLEWNGTSLTINGGGTFTGALSAATGTFAGSLSAATGTFAGSLSAATGSFAGSLSAASGTFAGTLTAGAVNAVNTINIAGNAVTLPQAAYSAGAYQLGYFPGLGAGVEGVIQQLPTFTSKGGKVVVNFACRVTPANGVGGSLPCSFYLRRNGAVIMQMDNVWISADTSVVFPPVMDQPGDGAVVTYQASIYITGGGGQLDLVNRGMYSLEAVR